MKSFKNMRIFFTGIGRKPTGRQRLPPVVVTGIDLNTICFSHCSQKRFGLESTPPYKQDSSGFAVRLRNQKWSVDMKLQNMLRLSMYFAVDSSAFTTETELIPRPYHIVINPSCLICIICRLSESYRSRFFRLYALVNRPESQDRGNSSGRERLLSSQQYCCGRNWFLRHCMLVKRENYAYIQQ